MFGILNINKHAGWTSRDVVNRVQSLVRPAKVGHAGTLDPLATGVLVVCTGPATRLIQYVQQMQKDYLATFLLGCTSPSEDRESEITELVNPPQPTLADIHEKVPLFVGCIQQRPPAYSALKVRGRRAYKLARQGEHVELESRPVTIHSLQIVRYEYPELELRIACGSGTYVRSLGRDLAESLGTGAIMSALERTAIGEFQAENAISLDDLSKENLAAHLLSPLTALTTLPKLTLTPDQIRTLHHGKPIPAPTSCDALSKSPSNEIVALNTQGQLVAILVPREDGSLQPSHNFPLPD